MFVNIAYPGQPADAEVQLFPNDTVKTLMGKIVAYAPESISSESLFSKYGAFVLRGHSVVAIDFSSTSKPVSAFLKDDDTIEIRPGAVQKPGAGQPVQIISYEREGKKSTFTLNEDAVEQILGAHGIRDLPCVVVSLAGPFRTGKSFILNFFLRYLEDPESWMKNPETPLEGGFPWKHGVERDTTGIWIWSKPIVRKLEDGQEVAIILVDTQGTFDNSTTANENAKIFAINALISSLQIYNIKEKISEDILQHMHLFTEFGVTLSQKIDGSKPFQSMQFLVRDWEFEDYAPGSEGGQMYLKSVFGDDNEDQPEEIRHVRTRMRECYEHMSCFLLPDPGKKIKKSTFQGELSALEKDFRTHLEAFVPQVLSTDNLIIKKVGSESVTCHNLITYLKANLEAFNTDGELPDIEPIVVAMSKANQENVKQESLKVYADKMRQIAGPSKPYIDGEILDNTHHEAFREAMDLFEDSKLLGGNHARNACQTVLEQEIKEKYQEYRKYNDSKDILKGLRTPFAFAALAFVVHILSIVLDVVELDMIAGWLNSVAWISALLVVLWASLNYTGNAPGVVQQLDHAGGVIWQSGKDAILQYAQHQAPSSKRTRASSSKKTN